MIEEKIAKIIWCDGSKDNTGWETSYDKVNKGHSFIIAQQILSLPVEGLDYTIGEALETLEVIKRGRFSTPGIADI